MRSFRPLPLLLLGLTVAVELTAVVLSWGLEPRYDTLLYAVSTPVMAATGALIISRHPRSLIGWLLLANGMFSAVFADLGQGYALRAAAEGWPAGSAGDLTNNLFLIQGPAFALIALLFPADELPSRRWQTVVLVGFVGSVVGSAGWVLSARAGETFAVGTNPYAVSRLPTSAMFAVGFAVTASVMCAAFVAVGWRYWHATGIERQQLRLFAAATTLLLALPVTGAFVPDSAALAAVVTVALSQWSIAIAVAVLRYRLYEVDVVINKTVVLALLAFFITSVYVAIVVGVGRLVGGGDRPNLALSIAATAVVAVAFQPVRERVQRLANRLVYGRRATPYEVLSEFADRVGGSYAAAELLPTMARTVAQGVGAARVEVWLATTGARLERAALWPADDTAPEPVRDRADLIGDRVVEVRHRGEVLGALTVRKPEGEPLTPTEERLLDDVAAQAGLVLRNVRLIDELRSSRARLVTTQDEERRRLERNLHDGAQQRLVAVTLMIRAARVRVGDDEPTTGAALDQAAEQLQRAIGELRDLARGIHPVILTERGLVPAVRALAERSPVAVTVEGALEDRLPPAVEASLYFVVAEALTNVAKYARATNVSVNLRRSVDEVLLEVTDDGVGGADSTRGSGLRGLADRVAVVDGALAVQSPPGGGTRITCTVPVGSKPGPAEPTVSAPFDAVPLGAPR